MGTTAATAEKQMTEGQWVLVEIKGGLAEVETNVDAEILKVDWDAIDDDAEYVYDTIEMVDQSALPAGEKERILNEILSKWVFEKIDRINEAGAAALRNVDVVLRAP